MRFKSWLSKQLRELVLRNISVAYVHLGRTTGENQKIGGKSGINVLLESQKPKPNNAHLSSNLFVNDT